MNKRVVPFSSPDIKDSDVKSVELSIKSGWLAHGDYSKSLKNYLLNLLAHHILPPYQIVQPVYICHVWRQVLTNKMRL